MHKYIKRIAALLLFIVCFFLINHLFCFLLIDDRESYTRIMMHEMYEQENIDVLFLGSSHCYRSIVPEIMDREMNVLTFNGGTSSQQPVASYYLLKEAAKEHKIDRVYMELYYDLLRDNKDYQSPTAVYIISDYMKASWNKLQFLWDTGGKDYLAHGLFYGRREWSKLFEPSSIMKNIRIKNSDTYWNYAYVTAENEAYTGKGFVYNYEFIKKGEFASKTVFPPIEENAISDVNKMWLDKMILFCKKNDIELVFYTAPVPDFRLAGCGNYDEFGRQVKHFLEGKDVPYYDFNLCKADFMKMEDEYFKDDNHLNGNGAEIFSLAFAHFFTDNLSSEEVFWESYEQKLENSEERVFGVICEMQRTEDGTMEAVIEPVTNMEDPPYLAVYKRRETEENYQLYREYSIEKTFKLPANEYGYIHIYVSGDPESKSFSNDATFYYGSE